MNDTQDLVRCNISVTVQYFSCVENVFLDIYFITQINIGGIQKEYNLAKNTKSQRKHAINKRS